MALCQFIALFILSYGSNQNQQRYVSLMWCAALCSDLVALSCGWVKVGRNPPTLIAKTLEGFLAH